MYELGLFCANSKCRHYFEDNCTLAYGEVNVKLVPDDFENNTRYDSKKKCGAYELGTHEMYREKGGDK